MLGLWVLEVLLWNTNLGRKEDFLKLGEAKVDESKPLLNLVKSADRQPKTLNTL